MSEALYLDTTWAQTLNDGPNAGRADVVPEEREYPDEILEHLKRTWPITSRPAVSEHPATFSMPRVEGEGFLLAEYEKADGERGLDLTTVRA